MISKVIIIYKGTGDERVFDDIEAVETTDAGNIVILSDGQMDRILNMDVIREIQVYYRDRIEDGRINSD